MARSVSRLQAQGGHGHAGPGHRGGPLSGVLNWCFKKSIWVYHVNAGSCNGCDIEVLDVLTPYYDVERFGIRLVHTPRHADALLVAGPVTRQIRERLLRLYESTPDPKLVIAVGSCPTGGGIWHNSYATLGGLGYATAV